MSTESPDSDQVVNRLGPVRQETYEQEMDLVSRLSHPVLLPVIKFVPFEEGPAVVTPRMRMSVYTMMQWPTPDWTLTRKYLVLYGVACGIKYVHDTRLLVGQLDPRNVLLDAALEPKIADLYVLSVIRSGQSSLDDLQRFLAPEIQEDYTPESDIFSFGMLMYSVLSGSIPYSDAKTAWGLRGRMQSGVSLPGVPGIEPRIDELMRECIDCDPEHRPDIDQVIERLSDWDNIGGINGSILRSYQARLNGEAESDSSSESESSSESDSSSESEDASVSSGGGGTAVLTEPPSLIKALTESVYKNTEDGWKKASHFYKTMEDFSDEGKAIGRGGAGPIRLAKYKETGELVAMKPIRVDDTEASRKSYEREVEILGNFNHPVLLQLLGCTPFPEEGTFDNPVIMTAYMPKGDLHKVDTATLTATQKHIILYGIASALMFLHEHRVIHRDIKPGNIFLDDNFEPRIGDFGHAKVCTNEDWKSQSFAQPRGTAEFMAPEIWQDPTCFDFKVDVYAFAMVMYLLVTNQKRVYGDVNFQTVRENAIEGVRPDIDRFEDVPELYKKIVKLCWDDDPHERPEFREIVRDLEDVPADVDVGAFLDYKRRISMTEDFRTERERFTKCDVNGNAIDQRTDDPVVVHQYENEPQDREKFTNIVDTYANLRHSCILPLIGYGFGDEQKPFIVTRFMPDNLASVLSANPKWWTDNGTAKSKLVFGLAVGMAFAHEKGYVHGDLRPENIFFNESHEPCIGNFLFLTRSAEDGRILSENQARYAAPEVLSGRVDMSEASDVYSYAMLVYHCCYGSDEILWSSGDSGWGSREQRLRRAQSSVFPVLPPDHSFPAFYQEFFSEQGGVFTARPKFCEIVQILARDTSYMFPKTNKQKLERYQERVLRDANWPF